MSRSFEELYKQLMEMMSADVLGPGSETNMGGAVGNKDFYNPGSTVLAKPLGACKKRKMRFQRRNLKRTL